MSRSPLPSTSSSNFDSIFRTSFKAYKKQTGHDITSHPLVTQLKTCDSPDAILAILRAQVAEFDQSRRDDERLTKWLNPTVNVLYAFSAHSVRALVWWVWGCLIVDLRALTFVFQVFSPAKVIFAGIGVLLLASKDVAATTKEIRQGRAKKFINKLVGRRDIEDALQRLDRLTQEEARMATAEVLRLTHGVDDKVRAVDDRVRQVDDRMVVVNDNVKLIVDGGKENSAAIARIVNTVDDMNRSQLRRDLRNWISPPTHPSITTPPAVPTK
ncbi:hypothetical protein H4582DRAFT_2086538 [Lactarius indigo]|nr:hypothetical protein H4582DRAFT_2086538 [Lactarius indigo]